MTEEKDSTFKVTDRRKFNPDGTPRDLLDDTPPAVSAESSSPLSQAPATAASARAESQPEIVLTPNVSEPPRQQGRSAAADEPEQAQPEKRSDRSDTAERDYQESSSGRSSRLPEASFFSMVNILAVEAAMHLGLLESPEGRTPVDLDAARHMIDMLGLLQNKTRGNLTPDEDRMLENVLADLRVQFVALSRAR